MTTIVADLREGALYGDTFTGYGVVDKLWRGRGKSGIFGAAGHDTVIARFQAHVVEGKKKPDQIISADDDRESFWALQLTCDGRLLVWGEAMRAEPILSPFWAIGSGGDAAIGAMKAGASPQRAIEIAAELDRNTKPPFTKLYLRK